MGLDSVGALLCPGEPAPSAPRDSLPACAPHAPRLVRGVSPVRAATRPVPGDNLPRDTATPQRDAMPHIAVRLVAIADALSDPASGTSSPALIPKKIKSGGGFRGGSDQEPARLCRASTALSLPPPSSPPPGVKVNVNPWHRPPPASNKPRLTRPCVGAFCLGRRWHWRAPVPSERWPWMGG